MKKPMTEETSALLGEAKRQTDEMAQCKARIEELGAQRRQVLAGLRAAGVTYKFLGESLGLHTITLQQTMKRYRDEHPIETWESFTKVTASPLVERAANDS